MARSRLVVVALLLTACAPETGKQLSAPINAALSDIHVKASDVLKTGAEKQDLRVAAIIKDDETATKAVTTMTTKYDKVVTTVAKKDHRIFIDDCIFGAVALAILTPILIKLVPFLMAL